LFRGALVVQLLTNDGNTWRRGAPWCILRAERFRRRG
jgi:hypothetical protein